MEDEVLSGVVVDGDIVSINSTLENIYELQVYQFCSISVVLGLLIVLIIAKGVNSRGL